MIIDANKSIYIKKKGQCNSDILDINRDDVNCFNCTFSKSKLMLNIGSCPFFVGRDNLKLLMLQLQCIVKVTHGCLGTWS